MSRWLTLLLILFALVRSSAQTSLRNRDTSHFRNLAVTNSIYPKQFTATTDFLAAAINSINSFNSLLKKEAYRIKITSFNNPTSSDMGFNFRTPYLVF